MGILERAGVEGERPTRKPLQLAGQVKHLDQDDDEDKRSNGLGRNSRDCGREQRVREEEVSGMSSV